jgi:integrase
VPGRRQHGEGSVYHRADRGQWVAVADLGWKAGGKRDRREFTGPDPASALEKRAKFLDRRRDGFTLPRGRQPYVSEWVLFWCHHTAKAQLGPTSWESYRQKCEDLVAPYFEKVKLAELSAEDIEDWHAALLKRPKQRGAGTLSPSTVGMAHSIFSACLKEAARRRRIAFNPCSIVSPPSADREPPEPPSADETDMLLAACAKSPNGARWVLAITTGLRQGEALGLRWRDVRLAEPASVTVRQSQARVDGEWVWKDPKSRK